MMIIWMAMFSENGSEKVNVVFPDFPGCVSHGKNLDHAVKMAMEAIGFHVRGMVEDGMDIPTPTSAGDVKTHELANGADFIVGMAMEREKLVGKPFHGYVTDRVTPPGWILRAWLDENQEATESFMARTGMPALHLKEFLIGSTDLSEHELGVVAEATGMPLDVLKRRQARYREWFDGLKNQYSMNMRWSDEDQEFVCTCKEFPGLAALGETREKALAAYHEGLEMMMECMVEDGDPLPKPIKVKN